MQKLDAKPQSIQVQVELEVRKLDDIKDKVHGSAPKNMRCGGTLSFLGVSGSQYIHIVFPSTFSNTYTLLNFFIPKSQGSDPLRISGSLHRAITFAPHSMTPFLFRSDLQWFLACHIQYASQESAQ
jgi:hypothetical protein